MKSFRIAICLMIAVLLAACSQSGNVEVSIDAATVSGDNADAVQVSTGKMPLSISSGPQGFLVVRLPLVLKLVNRLPVGDPSETITVTLLDKDSRPLCHAQLDDSQLQSLREFLSGDIGGQQQFAFEAIIRPSDRDALHTAVALRLSGFSFLRSPSRRLVTVQQA